MMEPDREGAGTEQLAIRRDFPTDGRAPASPR
jgi:hypothetical protein